MSTAWDHAGAAEAAHERKSGPGGPGAGLVLLAAGASSRMGSVGLKQLLPLRGRTLVRHAAEVGLASSCRPVVVVLGAGADRVGPALGGLDVVPVFNERWAEGMGTSIGAGVGALEWLAPAAGAVIIWACDQPAVSAAHLDRLVGVYCAGTGRCRIVASGYAGAHGIPALFARELFVALRSLPAASGARALMDRNEAWMNVVALPGGERDVDTQQDYRELCAGASGPLESDAYTGAPKRHTRTAK
jgi:molybdenum cofactor cytidylyltransferase